MAVRILLLLYTLGYLVDPAVSKWYEINGTEFYLTTYSGESSYTWAEAQSNCMSQGARLASIHSQEEMDQIMKWSEEESWYNSAYWLGFNNLQRQGFVWSDGSEVDYESWANGWPNTDSLGRYCAFTNPKTEGNWYNDHCSWQKGYICRRPADVTPSTITTPATTKAPGYCPIGYFDAGNKCFKLVTVEPGEGATFEEAVDRCRRETVDGIRPDIACIHSNEENALITSQMQEFQVVGLWIGLTTRNQASWMWVDNKDRTYLNWAQGMPDRYRGDCAEMVYRHPPTGHTGTWYNDKCEERKGYICQVEKDPSKVISTPQSTTKNHCPPNSLPYDKGCYTVNTGAKSWSDANQTCVESGAALVSIHSEPENSAILTMWSHLSLEDVWIGLYDRDANDVYHWSDGWYVMYTRWDSGEPKTIEGPGCVVMATNGKWSNTGCMEPRGFICKTTSAPAITTPAHLEGKCPKATGWMPFGDYCYKFERDDRGDWVRAQEKCFQKHEHAQLASIHDLVENDWIFKNMLATDPWADAWLGLYRGKDGEFTWVDRTVLQYTHWMPGSPVEGPTDKNCVVMKMKENPKLWMDTECSSYQGYICKTPKRALPTPPPDRPGSCPQGWTPYGGHCYWFEPDMFSFWSGAQEECEKMAGNAGNQSHLASIYGEHENDFIHEEMMRKNNLPKTRNYWIGARKNGIGQPFHWQNGDSVGEGFWAQDYPTSDPNGILNCVEVEFTTGLWKNTVCDNIRGLVCKVPKEPLNPTTSTTTTSTTTTSNTTTATPSSSGTTINGGPVVVYTGLHGGSVAAIILALLLLISLCIHVAFAFRHKWGIPRTFNRFTNPLSGEPRLDLQDEGTVEFRHGSTASRDVVRLDTDGHYDREDNNEHYA